tara:strand:- start:348 stop:482 length:135 start_codon:yes stop_codon:yes gene_type:complete
MTLSTVSLTTEIGSLAKDNEHEKNSISNSIKRILIFSKGTIDVE